MHSIYTSLCCVLCGNWVLYSLTGMQIVDFVLCANFETNRSRNQQQNDTRYAVHLPDICQGILDEALARLVYFVAAHIVVPGSSEYNTQGISLASQVPNIKLYMRIY